MQDWDEKGEPGVARTLNKKKKTARWCRGKVGVEHVTEIVVNHNFHAIAKCRWFPSWRRVRGEQTVTGFHWSCNHSERCVNCGKYVSFFLKDKKQCPDWKPLETHA